MMLLQQLYVRYTQRQQVINQIQGAAALASAFAAKLKEANLTEIVFDRNGYQYHGVIAAFGEALRANEIKF
jgi:large subunit ribosomal protein L18